MKISMSRGALVVGLTLLLVGCGSSLPPVEGATGGIGGGGNHGEGGAICTQRAPDGATFSICADASGEGGGGVSGGQGSNGGNGGKAGSDSGPVDATTDLPAPPVGAE
jgi:hypothetical protein